MRRSLLIVVASVTLSGCYHAIIDTRPAGVTQQSAATGAVVTKPWAHGFLFGLVPPTPVDANAKCPNGVARVETQQSFVNGLANFLTGGLYTPMTITITCAAGR
jgi:hypothetical protein